MSTGRLTLATPMDASFPSDSVSCPQCGADNSGYGRYCGACGAGFAPSSATRYVCAAVHRSWLLTERILSHIVNQVHRAPAQSPDVDIVAVVEHAMAARRRRATVDLLLTLLLVVFLLVLGLSESAFPALSVLAAYAGLVWLVVFTERLVAVYGPLAQSLRPNHVPAGPGVTAPSGRFLRTRLAWLQRSTSGNVAVYGGYSPFFGSGSPIGSWSFALDRLRSAEDRSAQDFTAQDIHEYVVSELRAVGLARVSVEDRLFVDGRDLVGDRRFLATDLTPPTLSASEDLLRSLRVRPEDRIRPYACFSVQGWDGQLVATTYLRFVVTRRHLFVEATNCLLPPVKETYQDVDRLGSRPTVLEALKMAVVSIPLAYLRLSLAPLLLGWYALGPVNRWWLGVVQRRQIISDRAFNYGATYSPRQAVSDRRYQRYFQQLDSDQYLKIVEKNIFLSMVDFLDEHGVDTTELVERQTTIQNNGVYVTGGATVNASNIAAGYQAKATFTPREAGQSLKARLGSSGRS